MDTGNGSYQKKVIRMADGRRLIFYSFPDSGGEIQPPGDCSPDLGAGGGKENGHV